MFLSYCQGSIKESNFTSVSKRLHSCLSRVPEFPRVWFSCICRFLHHNLDFPCSYIFSVGYPELGLVFGFRTLHLVPSGTREKLYDNSWGIPQSDYRGKPIQALSPLLLGAVAWDILVDLFVISLALGFSITP